MPSQCKNASSRATCKSILWRQRLIPKHEFAKLLKQGDRYHKLRKAFSKFYLRHYGLVSKFNVWLQSLLKQGQFNGDLVYKFKKKLLAGMIFLISSEKQSFVIKEPDITWMLCGRLHAWWVSTITVNNFTALFNCTPVDWVSVLMKAPA